MKRVLLFKSIKPRTPRAGEWIDMVWPSPALAGGTQRSRLFLSMEPKVRRCIYGKTLNRRSYRLVGSRFMKIGTFDREFPCGERTYSYALHSITRHPLF